MSSFLASLVNYYTMLLVQEEAHVGKQACARTHQDTNPEVFLDGLTYD